MTTGKKLYDLRKQKGISQEELAIDLDISQSSISNYELEVSKPDIETLKKFSQYYKIPIQHLISDDSYTFTVNAINKKSSWSLKCKKYSGLDRCRLSATGSLASSFIK